jgi:hypothetical protein
MTAMQSQHVSRQSLGRREDGVALIVTLMVLMLISVLMVGFVAAVIADTRASGLDRDQTQAYAASHAGLEQITSDLTALFTTDFSPSGAQVAALRNNVPLLPGFRFVAPGETADATGYQVAPRFVDAGGNPRPEDPVNGSVITSGPYQGFRGIITPYDITVTARACPGQPPCDTNRGGAEVRMRRTLQTVAIPVFQFGMFSETDLAFHAGETFSFGGRVHTNGNLFLANAGGGTLTIQDRVTAFLDVVRTHLPNGLATSSSYNGAVRIPTTIAANPANNVYRNLGLSEGSLTGTIPRTTSPSNVNPNWKSLSVGTYKSNIRNGDTGAKRLELPLVADLDGNGEPDAQPIELIRRPATTDEDTNALTSMVYSQRFFAQASVRILLSDTAAEIQNLPTVTQATQPVALFGPGTRLDYAPMPAPLTRAPLGSYDTPGVVAGPTGIAAAALPGSVYKGNHDEPVLGGYIKIEIQRAGTTPTNGVWEDVTAEVLGLGIAGRNLADMDEATYANRWNKPPSGATDTCPEPHPNAIIRLQRVRDIPINLAPCGVTVVAGVVTAVSQNEHDYWSNALYDTREAQTRDGIANTNTDLVLSGVMHYVEFDVNNLRRWLAGQFAAIGAASGPNAKNDNGYIVYFSDRRNNKNNAGVETAEYGFEDVTNPAVASGAANGQLDPGEDSNANGTLEVYGRMAQNVPGGAVSPCVAGYPNPLHAGTLVTSVLTNVSVGIGSPVGANCAGGQVAATVPTYVKALVARANRPLFFRRALKVVNGGLGGLPQGLTIVAENPVYVQGNFNATAASVTVAGNVPAAVIADAVTLLSNNWNDLRSFTAPTNSLSRVASSTGYRMALVSGKGLAFPQPTGTSSSFGSDGGAHNFVRSLEEWDNGGATIHRYRGSMVSFFIARQAVGTFKCCSQDAYNRGNRDWSFDTDFLLPTRLPPGTPMFRDVNTLTFRQLLRPTQ